MKSILFSALFAAILPFLAAAQTDCFSFACGQSSGQTGDTVCLPITAEQFSGVLTAQFSLRWNPTVMEFVNFQPGAMPGVGQTNFNSTLPGIFNFAWFDPNLQGVSLPNGATIFSLCFKITGQAGSFSPFFISNSPVVTEFSDVNGQILSPNFTQGGLTVLATGQSPNDPILMKGCVQNMACAGPNGSIDVTVAGGEPPYSYLWTGPNGLLQNTQDLAGLVPGLYRLTVSDAAGMTKKADFFVENTINPGFALQLEAIPATCPLKTDGQVLLDITGNPSGPLTFSWSNDSTSQILTGAPAGTYSVSATDALGCQVVGQVAVGEEPGFTASFIADQPNCLTADSLGGLTVVPVATTGAVPFSFQWNTGATAAQISDVNAGTYSVTVTEAGGCSAVFSSQISDDLLVDWKLSIATSCATDTALGSIEATLFLNSGGTAPFEFAWSNGSVETISPPAGQPPVGHLTNSLSGIYDLKIEDANGCELLQKGILLDCKLPFNVKKSCFTVQGHEATAPGAQAVCVPFVSQNMDSLVLMQFALTWDTTKLTFDHASIPPATLPGADFVWNPASPDVLKFIWYDQTPNTSTVSALNGATILEACFLPKGLPGEVAEIKFTALPTFPLEVGRTKLGIPIPFNGQNARISFGPALPADLRLEACSLRPDCAADGLSGINLSVSGGSTPFIYEWAGPSFSASTEDVAQLQPGSYGLTVTDAAGETTTGLFEINPVTSQGLGCVWPGDADDNASANHFDLLTLGLGMGHTGPARAEVGTLWTGYSSPIWADATPVSGINFRNLDADGDGIVSTADVAAIETNWGETIFPTAGDPNLQPPDSQSFSAIGGQVVTLVPSDTLEASEAAAIPIELGMAGSPAVDLLGVAMSIFYDTSLVKPSSVHFLPGGSWLGTAGSDLVFVEKNFPQKGRLDVALTRTDGQGVTGDGPIGLAYIVIEDDIYLRGNGTSRGPTDTLVQTGFQIRNVRAITSAEQLLDVAPKDAPFFLRQTITTTSGPGELGKKIIAFPNPASSEIRLESSVFMEQAGIFGTDGRFFFSKEIRSEAGAMSLDGLPPGIFLLKIQTAEGVAVKKFFKL